MTPPNRSTTADELRELPDDHHRHELVAGCVVSEPPASFRHGDVAAELFRRLIEFVRTRALGRVVSTETGFLLARNPDTVRAPDVAFVSNASIERAGRFRGFFPGPPDLAVEVLSPSERPRDVHAKVADYLAAGCRRVWVVDVAERRVRVHHSLLRPSILEEPDTLEGDEVLPGLRIPVARLFDS
jgi:Uma2 family endonuclease